MRCEKVLFRRVRTHATESLDEPRVGADQVSIPRCARFDRLDHRLHDDGGLRAGGFLFAHDSFGANGDGIAIEPFSLRYARHARL